MKPIRLIPAKTTINFFALRWLSFGFTLAVVLGTGALMFSKGLEFGIDFTGGIVIEIRTEQPVEIGKVRELLSHNEELGTVELQEIGGTGDLMIRLQGKDEDRVATTNTVKSILDTSLGTTVDYRRIEYVGPQVGKELIRSGATALILSILAIMVYIWVRFEWQYGISAILSLAFDLIATLGFYSLLGLEFNLTSIAAILTVLGYSINDKVVIFDRVRENLRKFKKMPLQELLNLSINDTLSRTVMTVSTTLLALVALIWLGGEVIRGFCLAMFFGIIAGTYSSVFVGFRLLIALNLRNERPATAEQAA